MEGSRRIRLGDLRASDQRARGAALGDIQVSRGSGVPQKARMGMGHSGARGEGYAEGHTAVKFHLRLPLFALLCVESRHRAAVAPATATATAKRET